MNGLSPEVLVTIVSIITSGIVIMVGVIVPETWEGKIAIKAVEGIARQPEAAGELRTTMIIAMALVETGVIFQLLVVMILLFANPLITRFFGG